SNSKRMEESCDVKREHVALIKDLKSLLRKCGTIMFSKNKRGFRIDLEGLAEQGLNAQQNTQKTHSPDFYRKRQINKLSLIKILRCRRKSLFIYRWSPYK
ncbi:hypothetical protein QLF84_23460, partial [Salmonella enterica subsp. enterica serovar Oslo]|nr:hypothetical protein [Salmonella enterica subsp. enterica serovar Oslo]